MLLGTPCTIGESEEAQVTAAVAPAPHDRADDSTSKPAELILTRGAETLGALASAPVGSGETPATCTEKRTARICGSVIITGALTPVCTSNVRAKRAVGSRGVKGVKVGTLGTLNGRIVGPQGIANLPLGRLGSGVLLGAVGISLAQGPFLTSQEPVGTRPIIGRPTSAGAGSIRYRANTRAALISSAPVFIGSKATRTRFITGPYAERELRMRSLALPRALAAASSAGTQAALIRQSAETSRGTAKGVQRQTGVAPVFVTKHLGAGRGEAGLRVRRTLHKVRSVSAVGSVKG